jgi:hypothetical protein
MPETQERKYLDDVPRELQDLIYEGKKIAAIKLVREDTGADLKSAKETVDSIASRLGCTTPKSKGGCLGVVLAIPVLGLAAYSLVHMLAR